MYSFSRADGTDFSVYTRDSKTLTMTVGEVKKYYISSTDHNAEWEVIGDNVVIADPREMTLGDNMGSAISGYPTYQYSQWMAACQYIAIYAVKPGKCTLIRKSFYHSSSNSATDLLPIHLSKIYFQKIEITVTGSDPTSMVMQHQLHLGIGQTHTLSPRLLPSGTSSTLTWYSSNTNVATVSGGKITAVAVGDATITCITANGLREDCEVTVTPTMVSNLSLNQDQLQMSVGDTYQFSAAIAPENATYKQVTWTSMNPDVVSIDNNGLMSCLSNGWSVILATTVDGSNLTAGCFVQVGASEGGDVNGDGVISIKDVTELIDRLLRG